MKPTFWKLSQSTEFFTHEDMLQSIAERLVYVHKDTAAQGKLSESQGKMFIEANIGDYFYLTHGNNGIYILGQFIGPINYLSNQGEGWSDREFRVIARSKTQEYYKGPQKWWSPNHRSTFMKVPEHDLVMFEKEILIPFFNMHLRNYGL